MAAYSYFLINEYIPIRLKFTSICAQIINHICITLYDHSSVGIRFSQEKKGKESG